MFIYMFHKNEINKCTGAIYHKSTSNNKTPTKTLYYSLDNNLKRE